MCLISVPILNVAPQNLNFYSFVWKRAQKGPFLRTI